MELPYMSKCLAENMPFSPILEEMYVIFHYAKKDVCEPSMGTSHRLPNPVSKQQLINRITVVTNNRNITGIVTSDFYTGHQQVNLGCLHPVARVISYDMGFNPSTQR
jgi:hypothetical protein